MPEGTVEFELDDSEPGFEEGSFALADENFMQAEEGKNLSGTSSQNRDFSSGQANKGQERRSVRAEIQEIKKEQAQKNRKNRNRTRQNTKGRNPKKKTRGKGR